jgi:DNA invertase Pin-like site-specific DNA recombinase
MLDISTLKNTNITIENLECLGDNMIIIINRIVTLTDNKVCINVTEGGFNISDANVKIFLKHYTTFAKTVESIRRRKMIAGLERKKLLSPDGKLHRSSKGKTYRNTDKDEIVMEMRNKLGLSLRVISEKVNMSVSKVRYIINAYPLDKIINPI